MKNRVFPDWRTVPPIDIVGWGRGPSEWQDKHEADRKQGRQFEAGIQPWKGEGCHRRNLHSKFRHVIEKGNATGSLLRFETHRTPEASDRGTPEVRELADVKKRVSLAYRPRSR